MKERLYDYQTLCLYLVWDIRDDRHLNILPQTSRTLYSPYALFERSLINVTEAKVA